MPSRPSVPEGLPAPIYSVAQVRDMDRAAMERCAIPGIELMRRAGRAALEALRRRWPCARRVLVCCGAGNNAGDGYVLARLAAREGYAVRVLAAADPQRLRGDARRAWRECAQAGVAIDAFGAGQAGPEPQLIVDALLGTGVDRELEGAFADAVDWINATGLPVLALDVPSGLDADSGRVLGRAVAADITITFVGLKQGLFLGAGPRLCGELGFAGLGIPASATAVDPVLERLHPAQLARWLPARRRDAHKGDHGRLLLIGGAPGMPGAVRLAGEAALRAGAGLVVVAAHPDSQAAVMAGRAELICHAVADCDALAPLLERADGIVAGPGLGCDDWSLALLRRALAAGKPTLVDADGLNLLAAHADEFTLPTATVLTPHPGEAARLLSCTAAEVQGDRLGAARRLRERYRATAVLKGACTLVAPAGAEGEPVSVCVHGNPGMASAGMGDVLAGLIGALMVQFGDCATAARAGVLAHALAGDDAAARAGQRGLLAGDLIEAMRSWLNPN
jgi:ADP-dependent NAD(P)H-hydrate dehydratase / NAD(P)H-hydrate epimerase